MVEQTLTAHARAETRGFRRAENFFRTLIYFELEEDFRALPAAQAKVAKHAITTHSSLAAKVTWVSSGVQPDTSGSNGVVAGRDFPHLSPPVTFVSAGW